MATAARKARKKAGIPLNKTPKTATPLADRSWFNQILPGAPGTKHAGKYLPRSEKKKARAIAARGL